MRALTRAFFERTHTKDLDEISEDADDTPRPFCIINPQHDDFEPLALPASPGEASLD